MKANDKFRAALETSVATLITDAKAFQERIEETTKQAIAFAVAHGRTIYLNQLVMGLPANMAQSVMDLVDAFNRKAVATLVEKDKQSEILSTIDNDIARKTGTVVMFQKTRDQGYVIGKSDASKVARRIIGESYESEEALVTAMGKIADAATEQADNRRQAAFNESTAVARFRDNHVKRIAQTTGDAQHAFEVGVTLNSLIPDGSARKSENDLKSMIAGALVTAKKDIPDEFKAHLPQVTEIDTAESEVTGIDLDGNKGNDKPTENDENQNQGNRRGRRAA